LAKRASGLQKVALALQTMNSFAPDPAILRKNAKAISSLALATKELKPSNIKNLKAFFTALAAAPKSDEVSAGITKIGQSLGKLGKDADPAAAKNLNKLSVGFKNFVKTMGSPEFTLAAEASSETMPVLARNIKSTMNTLSKVERPKSVSLIAKSFNDFVTGLATLKANINNLPNKAQLYSLEFVASGIARAMKAFNQVKAVSLQFVGPAIEGLADMLLILPKLKVGADGIPTFSLRRLVRVGQFLARAFKGFAKLRGAGDTLHGLPAAVQSLSVVINMLSTTLKRGSGGIPTWSLRRLVRVGQFLARAFKGFNKIREPRGIDAAANALRSLWRVLPLMSELPKRLSKSRWKFWSNTIAKDIGRFLQELIRSLSHLPLLGRITGRFKESTLTAFGDALQAVAKIIHGIPTMKIGEIETVNFDWLESLFDGLRKGLKKLKGIRISREVADVLQVLPQIDDIMAALNKLEQNSGRISKLGAGGGILGRISAAFGSGGGGIRGRIGGAVAGTKQLLMSLGGVMKDLLTGNIWLKLGRSSVKGAFNFGKKIAMGIADGMKRGAEAVRNTIKRMLSALRPEQFVRNFAAIVRAARDFGNQVGNAMVNAGRTMSSLSRTMLQSGRQLLNSPFSLTRVMRSTAISTVADFQSIMTQIEVLGGVVGSELTTVNDFLLQLGADSVFSAGQAAEAFLDLTKAGLSVGDSMAALPPIMDLAAAGQIGVADASSLAIAAANSFNISFDETTRIADAFVAAANVGTAEVNDLAAAFPYVGSSANAFGQELEGTLAALTLLMDTGMQGSSAGRSLATLFTSMINPSAEAAGAVLELGERLEMMSETQLSQLNLSAGDYEAMANGVISITRGTNGEFRDLTDIIEILSVSMSGMNEVSRAEFATTVAGSQNAGRALLSLLNAYESGTGTIEDYMEAMEESSSAQTVGEALMDTFKGSIEAFQGSIETLLIRGLTPLLEKGLRPLVDFGTKVINFISGLPQPILTVVAAAGGLLSVMVTLAGIFAVLGGLGLGAMAVHFSAIGAALLSILNPLKAIAILVAAGGSFGAMLLTAVALAPVIALIAAGVYELANTLRDPRMSANWERINDAITLLKRSFDELLRPWKKVAGRIWDVLFGGGGSQGAQNQRLSSAMRIFNAITGFLNDLSRYVRALRNVGYAFSQFFYLLDASSNPVENIQARWENLYDLVRENPIFEAILGKGFYLGDVQLFFTRFHSGLLGLRDMITNVGGAFAQFFEDLFSGVGVFKSFTNLFSNLAEATNWSSVGDTMVAGFQAAIDLMWEGIIWGANAVTAEIGTINWDTVETALTTGLQTIVDGLIGVVDWGITSAINIRADLLADWFLPNKDTIRESIRGGIVSIWNAVGTVGIDLLDRLGIPSFNATAAADEWSSLGDDIGTAISNIITGGLGTLLGEDDEAIASKFTQIRDSITSFFDEVWLAVRPFANIFGAQLGVVWDSLREAFLALGEIDFAAIASSDVVSALGDALLAVGAVLVIIGDLSLASLNGILRTIPAFVDLINVIIHGDWDQLAGAISAVFDAFVGGFTDIIAEAVNLERVKELLLEFLVLIPERIRPDFVNNWIGDLQEGLRILTIEGEEAQGTAEDLREKWEGIYSRRIGGDAVFGVMFAEAPEFDTPRAARTLQGVEEFLVGFADLGADADLDTQAEAVDEVADIINELFNISEEGIPSLDLDVTSFLAIEGGVDPLRDLLEILQGFQGEEYGLDAAALSGYADVLLGYIEQADRLSGRVLDEDAARAQAVAVQEMVEAYDGLGQAFVDASNQIPPEFDYSRGEGLDVAGDLPDAVREGVSAVQELVTETDTMATAVTTDWDSVAATMIANAPIIVEQAGIIELSFSDMMTTVGEFTTQVNTDVPSLQTLVIDAFALMRDAVQEVTDKLFAVGLQLLGTKAGVEAQLPEFQMTFMNAFTLMSDSVYTLLVRLAGIGPSLDSAAQAAAALPGGPSAGGNIPGRAK
jgi:TP901 family phage tail tape measure protein